MSKYQWCLHCERVSKKSEKPFCPFKDCDGSVLDLIEWNEFREQLGNHLENLPEKPEEGKKYPLYP